jgi:hypothetical protein
MVMVVLMVVVVMMMMMMMIVRRGPQKYVILISDKTGFTASHVLTAALFQFAHISNRTNTQVQFFCASLPLHLEIHHHSRPKHTWQRHCKTARRQHPRS